MYMLFYLGFENGFSYCMKEVDNSFHCFHMKQLETTFAAPCYECMLLYSLMLSCCSAVGK